MPGVTNREVTFFIGVCAETRANQSNTEIVQGRGQDGRKSDWDTLIHCNQILDDMFADAMGSKPEDTRISSQST